MLNDLVGAITLISGHLLLLTLSAFTISLPYQCCCLQANAPALVLVHTGFVGDYLGPEAFILDRQVRKRGVGVILADLLVSG